MVAGRYRLDRLLGQGGMGEVWAATHAVTRRSVAMKFVKGSSHARPELRRRFMREARAASAVQHPNVVEVLDVFELDAETPVMVMEFLSGETLGKKLAREGQLELDEALSILLPAVSAVGTAHALGVVHRDLKPDNLFLAREPATGEGETIVKVLDFGIAKLSVGMAGETGVTETGTTLGTPCYMAPEQAMAERELDHRVDVWAFGVILYESLSGARPIDGDSVGQVVKHLMTTGITPLERVVPGLPAPLTALVARMLSRERNRRPEDLREVFAVMRELTTTRARSFGAPGSEAPSNEPEALSSSGDALILDSADKPIAQSEVQARVDTAGPHAVSSRLKRRPKSNWLYAGGAVTAIAVTAFALTRRESQPSSVPSGQTAVASAPEPVREPKPEREPVPKPVRVPVPVPVPEASARPTRQPVVSRNRDPKPLSSAPPASASARFPTAAPPPAANTGRKSGVGGLAEKPPF